MIDDQSLAGVEATAARSHRGARAMPILIDGLNAIGGRPAGWRLRDGRWSLELDWLVGKRKRRRNHDVDPYDAAGVDARIRRGDKPARMAALAAKLALPEHAERGHWRLASTEPVLGANVAHGPRVRIVSACGDERMLAASEWLRGMAPLYCRRCAEDKRATAA